MFIIKLLSCHFLIVPIPNVDTTITHEQDYAVKWTCHE